MKYLEQVDVTHPAFGDLYDELPLWSAPFGLMLLARVLILRRISTFNRHTHGECLKMEDDSQPSRSPRPTAAENVSAPQVVPTREGYDLWAQIYDDEDNPLIALET